MMLPRKRQRPNPAEASSASLPAPALSQQSTSQSQASSAGESASGQRPMPPSNQPSHSDTTPAVASVKKQVRVPRHDIDEMLTGTRGRFAKPKAGTDPGHERPRLPPRHRSRERTSSAVLSSRRVRLIWSALTRRKTVTLPVSAARPERPQACLRFRRTAPAQTEPRATSKLRTRHRKTTTTPRCQMQNQEKLAHQNRQSRRRLLLNDRLLHQAG